jgi:aryl-alcohol dehydrogenase-like predicted oxidoreductase
MKYRKLGASGLDVSEICLGAMMFGERTDETEAGRIVESARAAGVNFIDTADVYAKGRSEEMVGRLIARDREKWILATKVGVLEMAVSASGGLAPERITRVVDESLARLRTDWIDLWYFHSDDPETPIEHALEAMARIVAAGKVRHFGLSNFRAWRIAKIAELCRAHGWPEPVACEPYYNAVNRMPEAEILPACEHYGMGVVPYSPLARSILTGKYKPGAEPPADSRVGRGDKRVMQTEWRPESLAVAEKIHAHAAKRGMNGMHYAVNWVLNNRLVSSVIAGPRTLEQWQNYLEATRHAFTAADEAFLDTLVPAGHPSTPGYSDPRYPPLGRKPIVA